MPSTPPPPYTIPTTLSTCIVATHHARIRSGPLLLRLHVSPHLLIHEGQGQGCPCQHPRLWGSAGRSSSLHRIRGRARCCRKVGKKAKSGQLARGPLPTPLDLSPLGLPVLLN